MAIVDILAVLLHFVDSSARRSPESCCWSGSDVMSMQQFFSVGFGGWYFGTHHCVSFSRHNIVETDVDVRVLGTR